MVDFKKIAEKSRLEAERRAKMTPEDIAQEEQEEFDKLYPYVSKIKQLRELREGQVSEWAEKFLNSVYTWHVVQHGNLSDRQKDKIEELFHRYIVASAPNSK